MINQEPKRFTLDNGLNVTVLSNENYNGTYFQLDVNIGSCDEQLARDRGLCHLLSHISMRKTRDFDASDIASLTLKSGISIQCEPKFYETSYSGFCRPSNLGTTLSIIDNIIFKPIIDKDDLEKDKMVVIEEIKEFQSNPSNVNLFRCLKILFPRHRIHHPVVGDVNDVLEMKTTRVKEYVRGFHKPQEMTLGLFGAVPSNWMEILEEKAHGLSRKTRAANAIKLERDFGDPTPVNTALSNLYELRRNKDNIVVVDILFSTGKITKQIDDEILHFIVAKCFELMIGSVLSTCAHSQQSFGVQIVQTIDVGCINIHFVVNSGITVKVSGEVENCIVKMLKGDIPENVIEAAKNMIATWFWMMENRDIFNFHMSRSKFLEDSTPSEMHRKTLKITNNKIRETIQSVISSPSAANTIEFGVFE